MDGSVGIMSPQRSWFLITSEEIELLEHELGKIVVARESRERVREMITVIARVRERFA